MAKKGGNKGHIISRYFIVLLLFVLGGGMVFYELWKTEMNREAWIKKAESTMWGKRVSRPARGMILADDGSILAANITFYHARIDFTASSNKKDTVARYLPALCKELEKFDRARGLKTYKTESQWFAELSKGYTEKRNTAYLLFRNLTLSEYEYLTHLPLFNNKGTKGCGLYNESEPQRTKPFGAMAGRSVGRVTQKNAANPFSSNPKDSIVEYHGSYGLERALDSLLYGIPGEQTRRPSTAGLIWFDSKPPVPGYNITTTINVAMQDIVEEELLRGCKQWNAKWGTAVLVETKTGEIKAISNFDRDPQTGDYYETINHAVQGYEPGSVIKPISMMVALEDGIVGNIDAQIPTGTSYMLCGYAIKDHPGGASLSAREIIATSSNVGMSKLILRKYGSHPDGFRQRLEEMGFFKPLNSGISGEQQPRFANLTSKGYDHRLDLSRVAYGYASTLPPMHTLAMYNAFANDGKFIAPHLVRSMSLPDSDSIIYHTANTFQICKPENAAKLRIMLHDVVWSNRGTAKAVRNDIVEIAGKTGTCFDNEGGHYVTANSHKRVTFCGFFPYNNPKYTCIVLLYGAPSAGICSGGVLKSIALRLFAHGWLDNKSDINDDLPENRATRPVLFASHKDNNKQKLKNIASNAQQFVTPVTTNNKSVVPSVKGLALREAIATLETRQLKVKYQGLGYVVAQSLPPGHKIVPGETIILRLKN